MENNELKQLTNDWVELRAELNRSKKIKFDLFNEVFAKTFRLLQQTTAEKTIDKDYVALIVNATLFANADMGNKDFRYCAALVLTERMLNQIMSCNTAEAAQGATIYIFELRKEVYLDFNSIDESLEKLEKLFKAGYGKDQL